MSQVPMIAPLENTLNVISSLLISIVTSLLITLKCLKGFKSLGSLCNVKIKSHSVSQSVSQWVTRSPIELFWTAKNARLSSTSLKELHCCKSLQWKHICFTLCSISSTSFSSESQPRCLKSSTEFWRKRRFLVCMTTFHFGRTRTQSWSKSDNSCNNSHHPLSTFQLANFWMFQRWFGSKQGVTWGPHPEWKTF